MPSFSTDTTLSDSCYDKEHRNYFARTAIERGWGVKHFPFSSGIDYHPTIYFTIFWGYTRGPPEDEFGRDGDIFSQRTVDPTKKNVHWVRLGGKWEICRPYVDKHVDSTQWHPVAIRRVYVREQRTWVALSEIDWAMDQVLIPTWRPRRKLWNYNA